MIVLVIKTAKSAFEHYDRHFGKKNVPPEKKRQDKIVMALYFMGDEGRKSVLRQDIEHKCSIPKNEIMSGVEELTEKNYLIDESTMSGMKWRLNRHGISYVESIVEELEMDSSAFYIPDSE